MKIGNEVTKKRSGNLNAEVFQGMSNSSQFFRNILKPKRSLALLDPVFKIVVPRLQVYKKEKSSTDASKSEEDLDNDFQMKGTEAIVSSIILNSRGVCKVWNLTVDKIIYDLTNYKVFGEG